LDALPLGVEPKVSSSGRQSATTTRRRRAVDVQAALALFDVQTARDVKTVEPSHADWSAGHGGDELERSSQAGFTWSQRRLVPDPAGLVVLLHVHKLPRIVTSPAAKAPGRVRPCPPSLGKGRGWPGPDGSNVTLSDSDAIRVRVRAWRARPCPSGEAEGSRRAGTGRAPRRDGCVEEVAAGGRPGHRGDVLTWSFSTRAHWRAGVAAAPRVEPAGVLA
jgi:hypothetical protein